MKTYEHTNVTIVSKLVGHTWNLNNFILLITFFDPRAILRPSREAPADPSASNLGRGAAAPKKRREESSVVSCKSTSSNLLKGFVPARGCFWLLAAGRSTAKKSTWSRAGECILQSVYLHIYQRSLAESALVLWIFSLSTTSHSAAGLLWQP